MKFEIFRDKSGEWRFRIVAANGEIVAQSEGYTRKQSALDTIGSLKASGLDLPVEEK